MNPCDHKGPFQREQEDQRDVMTEEEVRIMQPQAKELSQPLEGTQLC